MTTYYSADRDYQTKRPQNSYYNEERSPTDTCDENKYIVYLIVEELLFFLLPILLHFFFNKNKSGNKGRSYGKIISILQVFSLGIILATLKFDMIPHVLENKGDAQKGLTMMFSSFILLFLVNIIFPHDHDHGDSHEHGSDGLEESEISESDHEHGDTNDKLDGNGQSIPLPQLICIMLAFLIHFFLDGLVLGANNRLTCFTGIAAHVWADFLIISSRIIGYNLAIWKMALLMVIMLFPMPLGFFSVGSVENFFSNSPSGNFGKNSMLRGLSAGAFLFLGFFEIPHEFRGGRKSKLVKFIALFTGFLLMASILTFYGHEHDDNLSSN